MKFRKKPVIIDAIQYSGSNVNEILSFVGKDLVVEQVYQGKLPTIYELYIETLEGRMRIGVGDYVIRGIKEEFYPCKPDIFEATYEKIEGE